MAQRETEARTFLALVEAARGRAHAAEPIRPAFADAVFEAQLLGQPGQTRGLRGGAPVLNAARGAYLSAEFAGEGDRRPAPGLLTIRAI